MALQDFLLVQVSIPSTEDKDVNESGKKKVGSVQKSTFYSSSFLRAPLVWGVTSPGIVSGDSLMGNLVLNSVSDSRLFFRVEVLFNERKHYVLRRASEFQSLHRKLRKVVQTPDYPSKRNPHLRTKPVEQRRQELQDYIQEIIYLNEDVPQVLLDFLHLKHFHTGNKISSVESLDELDSQESNYELPHQRASGFFRDPYLSERSSGFPDVVVDGVLQGFYPRDVRVSFNASTLPEHDRTPSVEA